MSKEMINRKHTFQRTLFAGAVAMAGVGFAGTAMAGMMPQGYVKCYGIARAHQNQCMSIGGVTRGSAKTNGNPDAWLAVPKGVCLKIVGSSLTPGKTPAKK